jgi:DNA-binding CsgD family transcriptional regulator
MDRRPERVGASLPPLFLASFQPDAAVELAEVLDAASRLVADPAFAADEVTDFAGANRALDAAWHAVLAALRGSERAAAAIVDSADLIELLTRIRGLDDAVHKAAVRRRAEASSATRIALSRLKNCSTVSELFDIVPEAVCGLGFDRSIISRIDDARWMPEGLLVAGDLEWSEEILAAGRAAPPPIVPTLYESEIVRRKIGILVTDVQEHLNRTHTSVAATSRTRSYVAAPLIPGSNVVGFLHADRYFHRGEVGEMDRDILVEFATGLSLAIHSGVLAERLKLLRSDVERLSGAFTVDTDDYDFAGCSAGHGAVSTSYEYSPDHSEVRDLTRALAAESPLTRRELEVLRLVATGATNTQIANRLVISSGTVKSHVKNVLRKLQAANRAEAVARWLSVERSVGTTSRATNAGPR